MSGGLLTQAYLTLMVKLGRMTEEQKQAELRKIEEETERTMKRLYEHG